MRAVSFRLCNTMASLVAVLGACAICLTPLAGHAKDPKPPVKPADKSARAAKTQTSKPQSPSSLPKSDKVLEDLKKTAGAEPTIISGRIEKGMTLKGLVVIKKDAELASNDIELVPTSGAIVVNFAPAVFYKPVTIKGTPFASICANAQSAQKSHLYVNARYWGADKERYPYDNCIFQGVMHFDTGCMPDFYNCTFNGSSLPGCDAFKFYPVYAKGLKDQFVNCTFQDFNLAGNDPSYVIQNIILYGNTLGFKGMKFQTPKPLAAGQEAPAATLRTDSPYAIYDVDGTIIPFFKQLTFKGNTTLNLKALSPEKNTLPYFDKAAEIRELLDEVAQKYAGPDPVEAAKAQAAKEQAAKEKAGQEKAPKAEDKAQGEKDGKDEAN